MTTSPPAINRLGWRLLLAVTAIAALGAAYGLMLNAFGT